MDNYQFNTYPPFFPTEDQEDWNTFFNSLSTTAEPSVYDTGVGGTVPEFVPGDAGYLPGALDALGTIGGQAPQSTSSDCTLWNPHQQPLCGFIRYEFSSQPSPISLGDVDFPFATPIASCDTDGIRFSHTLSELPVLSNYGDQAVTNVFEHFNETPVQLEMSISNRQTKSQATIGDQAVIQSGSISPSQLLRCGLDGCQMSLSDWWELIAHQNFHAKHHWVASQSPFICECGEPFTKLDTLKRHIRRFQAASPLFRCQEPSCSSAFQRKDHFVQHLRHAHRYSDAEIEAEFPTYIRRTIVYSVCHFQLCPYHRDDGFKDRSRDFKEKNAPFFKQSDYTKHMREVHEWSPYSCSVPSCDRRDKNGYFNLKALQKHRREKHPEEDEEESLTGGS
ncbi:PIF1-like helicase domain-containing protein [Apiospora arundinis]